MIRSAGEIERGRERERDRQTDRDRDREGQREVVLKGWWKIKTGKGERETDRQTGTEWGDGE